MNAAISKKKSSHDMKSLSSVAIKKIIMEVIAKDLPATSFNLSSMIESTIRGEYITLLEAINTHADSSPAVRLLERL
jgi:hypothetical protein